MTGKAVTSTAVMSTAVTSKAAVGKAVVGKAAAQLAFGAAVVLALVASLSLPASAHTDLLQTSPGRSQTVGGEVDFLDLVFLESVSDMSITVTGPDREVLEGREENREGLLIRYALDEPISEPGRYIVRYQMLSADGDNTNSGFLFEYDPTAVQPLRLGDADVPSQTAARLRQAGMYAVGVLLLVVIGLQIRGLFRKRSQLAQQRQPDSDTASTD